MLFNKNIYIFPLKIKRNEETNNDFLKTMHLLQRNTSDSSVVPLPSSEPGNSSSSSSTNTATAATSSSSSTVPTTAAAPSTNTSSSAPSSSSSSEETPLLVVTSVTLRDYMKDTQHLTTCAYIPKNSQLMNEMRAYSSYRSVRLGVEDEVPPKGD